LKKNGFAVLENFLPAEDLKAALEAGANLCKNIQKNERRVFTSSANAPHLKDDYFLESSNNISPFFEKEALDVDGNLLVDESVSLNKVGHGLHLHHPTFKAITFSDKVRDVSRALGFQKPAVVQSMYIYKNPIIGEEVKPHQDATYLHTEPEDAIYGFWIPLQDATLENGCLWFAPGSHKKGLKSRLVRNTDETGKVKLIYVGGERYYPDEEFVPCPVKKGSLVLIHGLVAHKSEGNKSDKSRHAFTFHVMDTENTKWSEENWLQLPEGETFQML